VPPKPLATTPSESPAPAQGKKLLDQVRDSLRLKHYSART